MERKASLNRKTIRMQDWTVQYSMRNGRRFELTMACPLRRLRGRPQDRDNRGFRSVCRFCGEQIFHERCVMGELRIVVVMLAGVLTLTQNDW